MRGAVVFLYVTQHMILVTQRDDQVAYHVRIIARLDVEVAPYECGELLREDRVTKRFKECIYLTRWTEQKGRNERNARDYHARMCVLF